MEEEKKDENKQVRKNPMIKFKSHKLVKQNYQRNELESEKSRVYLINQHTIIQIPTLCSL